MKEFFKKTWTNTTTFVEKHKVGFEMAAVAIVSAVIGFGIKSIIDDGSSEAPIYQIDLDDIPNNIEE